MKKNYFTLFILLLTFSLANAQNQYTYEPARWYVGSGNDTAYLVVDFPSVSSYDPPSSFVYGVLFDDSITGANILNAVSSADINFTVGYNGNFIDSVALGTHNGKNGVNSFYWGTWSDTISANRWYSNTGTGEMVFPNQYFGLSYTDFNPAMKPDTAVAINNSTEFTVSDVQYFIGSGIDTAVLVIDFLDGNSIAWGYLFNDSTTGEEMLNAIASNDNALTIGISNGFLGDITYGNVSGLSANPNYWNTWSAKNNGIWDTNVGVGVKIIAGDWFGCSYPNWPPAIYPTSPSAAINPTASVIEKNKGTVSIYPNPATSALNIKSNFNKGNLSVYNMTGQQVISLSLTDYNTKLDVSNFPVGIYTIRIQNNEEVITSRFVKK